MENPNNYVALATPEQVAREREYRDALRTSGEAAGGILGMDSLPLREKTPGVAPYPQHMPDQNFALVSCANTLLFSQSKLPAFRIDGVVSTHEEAVEITRDHPDRDSLFFELHPVSSWKLLPEEAYEDKEKELARIQEIFNDNLSKNEKQKKKFAEYCQKRKALEIEGAYTEDEKEMLRAAKERRELDRAVEEEEKKTQREEELLRISSCARPHRGQQFAVVGIIDPPSSVDLIFVVYAAFEVEREATRYAADTVSDVSSTFETYVVDMYTWLFPSALRSTDAGKIRSAYPHKLLDDIMTEKSLMPAKAQAYRNKCAEVGMTPKITEVTGRAEDVAIPTVEITYRDEKSEEGGLIEDREGEPAKEEAPVEDTDTEGAPTEDTEGAPAKEKAPVEDTEGAPTEDMEGEQDAPGVEMATPEESASEQNGATTGNQKETAGGSKEERALWGSDGAPATAKTPKGNFAFD